MTLSKNEILNHSLNLIESGMNIKIHAKGVSMYPALRKGDELVIEKVSIDKLKTGDVVAFMMGQNIIAHRLIKVDIERMILKTKGDSCYNADPEFSTNEYVGRVSAFIRKGKKHSLKTTKWKLFGKAIVTISSILPFVYKFAKFVQRIYKRILHA